VAPVTHRISFDDLEWDKNQRAVTKDGPYTGEVVEYDVDGNLVALTQYRNGFKDGEETHYYPDGTVAFRGTWRWADRAVGVHRSWYPNGQLEEEATFGDNGFVQDRQRWAEDGTPLPARRRRTDGQTASA
jgi:antitoxin component YwqK of YwqJK toxin-antitoxin module